MTTGEYIRRCRMGDNKYGKKWSLDELGKMLNPPVYRSAINKWELGEVVNIKKVHIEQLAEIFGVHPNDLMCFDSKHDEDAITEELATIEMVQKVFGRKSVEILQHFCELNELGKDKLIDEALDMLGLPKYTE